MYLAHWGIFRTGVVIIIDNAVNIIYDIYYKTHHRLDFDDNDKCQLLKTSKLPKRHRGTENFKTFSPLLS
jgi:hypothetical protein